MYQKNFFAYTLVFLYANNEIPAVVKLIKEIFERNLSGTITIKDYQLQGCIKDIGRIIGDIQNKRFEDAKDAVGKLRGIFGKYGIEPKIGQRSREDMLEFLREIELFLISIKK